MLGHVWSFPDRMSRRWNSILIPSSYTLSYYVLCIFWRHSREENFAEKHTHLRRQQCAECNKRINKSKSIAPWAVYFILAVTNGGNYCRQIVYEKCIDTRMYIIFRLFSRSKIVNGPSIMHTIHLVIRWVLFTPASSVVSMTFDKYPAEPN